MALQPIFKEGQDLYAQSYPSIIEILLEICYFADKMGMLGFVGVALRIFESVKVVLFRLKVFSCIGKSPSMIVATVCLP